MTFRSCLLYARKIVFSKSIRTGESKAGKRSLTGAVICIGLSLVPLVSVISISRGMFRGIAERMIYLFSQDISVSLYKDSVYADSYESFLEPSAEFLKIPGVTGAFPEVRGTALAASSKFRAGAFVRGIQEDAFLQNKPFFSLLTVTEGTFDLSGGRKAVIGEKIAELLGVHAGDTIRLISAAKAGNAYIPKAAQFTVSGVVSSGYQELDALWVFIPLESAFSCISRPSLEFFIGLQTEDPFSDSLSSVAADVRKLAMQDFGFENSRVLTWKEFNAAELENFASTEALLVVIMIMILLVASINISSSIVMIVMERKKEIALLKCVGGSSRGIALSFVLTGAAAGLLGILLGIPAALAVSLNINRIVRAIETAVTFFSGGSSAGGFHLLDPAYYLQEIPAVIPVREIFAVCAGTFILSVFASVVPSVRAGNEKPIDTLRKM